VVIADGVGGQTLQLVHGYCLKVFERRVAKFLFRSQKGNYQGFVVCKSSVKFCHYCLRPWFMSHVEFLKCNY